MLIQKVSSILIQKAFCSFSPFILLWVFLIFGGMGSLPCWGQNYDTLAVTDCNFQILAPNRVLEKGEAVDLTLVVGNRNNPVYHAIAMDLTLKYDVGAVFPGAAPVGLNNSWFFDSGTRNPTTYLHSGTQSVQLVGLRSTSKTGYGTVFTLTVVAGLAGTPANQLIKAGGGIIVVEDLGFKQFPTSFSIGTPPLTPIAFPNPCQAKIGFNWQGNQPQTVICRDLTGKQVAIWEGAALASPTQDLSNLPKGLYVLTYGYTGQSVRHEKLWVQ